MSGKVSLIVFSGHPNASSVEAMVAHVCRAITRDTIEKALELEICGQVILATDSSELAAELQGQSVQIEMDQERNDQTFHFGRRLGELIAKYDMQHTFYVGGGSGPLLDGEAIGRIAEQLVSQDEDLIITNNFFSTDFAAFTPGRAIERIELPATDNNLAYALHHQGGLRCEVLPQTAATLLDVDTPTDLMILQLWDKLHSPLGRHTRAALNELDLDIGNLEAVVEVMNDATGQLVVAGRVGSTVWSRLERDTACQTRVFSEERGMRAAGREGSGRVRSLLGAYLEATDATRFFAKLAEMGDAALIDTRVIFEHFGLRLAAADRFNSDLLRAEEIKNPFVRELTAAARRSPIPIVFGGHSAVAGGAWALVDAAQAARVN